jgi:alpha-glucosidase
MIKQLLIFTSIILLHIQSFANWSIISPNGSIKATVNLNSSGIPSYIVEYLENSTWINVYNPSSLGLNSSYEDFTQGLSFSSMTTQSINESYTMLTGKKSALQNHANQMILSFTKNGKSFQIIFRAYDDGIAFRYIFTDNTAGEYDIYQDQSGFKISIGGKMWVQGFMNYKPSYELNQEEKNVGENSNTGVGWCLPALIQSDNYYVLIGESDLADNYSGSHLGDYNNGEYRFRMPEPNDGSGNSSTYPRITLPMTFPWRFAVIGKQLSTIVETNMAQHLASPSTISDVSWIKPGVSTWSWWSDFYSPENFNKLKKFVDLADSLKVHYSLVDANWNSMTGGTLADVVQYANTKNIKIWAWYNSAGNHNNYNVYPRDKMNDRTIRRNEMAWLQSIGVKGIKVDFFDSDKQQFNKLCLDIIRDAADYQLMVNLHGATIPRGWQRTYPNLMTVEAVRGGEMLLFNGQFANESPAHNVNLVFTRNVIGSMDYTPAILGSERVTHNTTKSHEMALVSLFESGVTHLADSSGNYYSLPPIAQKMLSIPTAWDETKFIEGIPNDYVVLARRKGLDWYISGINGTNSTRTITLNPSFISLGDYKKLIVQDGVNAQAVVASEGSYRFPNSFSISMLPYGGFTVHLKLTCLDNLTINQVLNQTTLPFIARNIQAINQIYPGVSATFSANNSIILSHGFESQSGSIFKAEIGGCQNP